MDTTDHRSANRRTNVHAMAEPRERDQPRRSANGERPDVKDIRRLPRLVGVLNVVDGIHDPE